ncbi:photosystem II reaction center protein Psb28 [Pleurocapsa sp. PCC 7319]|uniref:photosystem II reaction center protein Psb28 n=1 Tax=Pleurocapsa sp. PCC 7319 TaxID=118161 RepID=UPI0003473A6A|nr:photosystem II reaction center protein Psb28 [Pleurocapsa sp. PCC 7319]
MAEIQFSRGIKEEIVPDIKVTRSKTGNTGTATFYFEDPKILSKDSTDEITGMYLVDDEGEIVSREVKGKFVNGEARAIEAVLIMKSTDEWERFIRFMNQYAEENGLGLDKS